MPIIQIIQIIIAIIMPVLMGLVAWTFSNIITLKTEVALNKKSIVDLDGEKARLHADNETNKNEIRHLETELFRNRDRIESNYELILQKFENFTARFDTIDNRLGTIENKLDKAT